MCAVFRLRHDRVDHPEHQAIVGSDFQRVGDVLSSSRVTMNDRRRAFGGNHRVHRVFLHQDAICDAERERRPAAPFADHHANDGHGQHAHVRQAT